MRKSARVSSHSTARQQAPAMTAASGCAPPMPPRPAVRIQRPVRFAVVVLASGLDEGLVGALHDALRADVDPGARGHLAVHRQTLAIELVEVLPGGPVRHEVRVRDQHARRIAVGAEHADGFPRLHEQRLVVLEVPQAVADRVEVLPGARRAPDAAVHDELVRVLGDVGVEVVHQHPERRLRQPALRGELGAGGGQHGALVVARIGRVGGAVAHAGGFSVGVEREAVAVGSAIDSMPAASASSPLATSSAARRRSPAR